MAPPHRASQPSFARPHSGSQSSGGSASGPAGAGAGGPPQPPPAPHYTHPRSLPGGHHMNAFARVPSTSSPFSTPLGAISTPSSSFRSTIMSRTSNSRADDDDDDEIPGDDDEGDANNNDGPGGDSGEIGDESKMSYSYAANSSQSSSQGGPDVSTSFEFPTTAQGRTIHNKHRPSLSSHPPPPPGMSLPPSPPKPGMPHDPYAMPPPPPFHPGSYPEYDQHHLPAGSAHYSTHGGPPGPYDASTHDGQTPASGAGGQSNAASPSPSSAGGGGPGNSSKHASSPDKARRTRVSQACDLCRKRKARCIGGRPVTSNGPQDPGQKCQRCTKQNADCQWSFFSDTGRQATTAKKRGRLNGCVVRENGESGPLPPTTSSSTSGGGGSKSSSRRRDQQREHREREEPSLPTPYQPEPHSHHAGAHHYDAGPYQDRYESAPFHPHLPYADYPTEPPPPPSWSPPSPPSPGASSSGGGPPAPMGHNGQHGRNNSPPTAYSNSASKRPRVSPPGIPGGGNGGSRASARQRTLDAAAQARESNYGMPPEAQSQETQAMAERHALVRSSFADDRGQHGSSGRPQPLVMEMASPSASEYRNGDRAIPLPRTILSDGMGGLRKRKRSPLSKKEEIQAAMLSSRWSPRDPRRALGDKLALRRQQRVAERQVGHATWAKPLATNELPQPATRARRNSIGSSQPTKFVDASVARWLEDNSERWGVVDASSSSLTPLPLPEPIEGLPACRIDANMVSTSTQPVLKSGWLTSSRVTLPTDDVVITSLDINESLRRLNSSGSHARYQDAIDAKLAGEDDATKRRDAEIEAARGATASSTSSSDLHLLLGLKNQSTISSSGSSSDYPNKAHRPSSGHGRTAFGYEWPPAEDDERQALPPSQQAPAQQQQQGQQSRTSDSQIQSIFDLQEAGLPSQQQSQTNLTAAAMAAVARQDADDKAGRGTSQAQQQRFSREEDEQAAVVALNNLTQTQTHSENVVGANMFALGGGAGGGGSGTTQTQTQTQEEGA